MSETDGWVSADWMRDGSGHYRHNGTVYRIVVQDLISTKHRVAFLDGKEIARASSFARLLRKLPREAQP